MQSEAGDLGDRWRRKIERESKAKGFGNKIKSEISLNRGKNSVCKGSEGSSGLLLGTAWFLVQNEYRP